MGKVRIDAGSTSTAERSRAGRGREHLMGLASREVLMKLPDVDDLLERLGME